MNIFDIHERLIDDYRAFTSAFVAPRDARIKAFIGERLAAGAQWPDPWISLNPSFAGGGSVTELIAEGLLHPECEKIFRDKPLPDDWGDRTLSLHRHQREAIEAARTGQSYVLTTGTPQPRPNATPEQRNVFSTWAGRSCGSVTTTTGPRPPAGSRASSEAHGMSRWQTEFTYV